MRIHRRAFIAAALILSAAGWAAAQAGDAISLPAPQMTGGKPLMDCLKARQSGREFGTEKLSLQTLSSLLWAADGINRPDASKRTAPTANNVQNMEVYAVMADGAYLYDAKANALKRVAAADLRAATGTQPFVKDVPLDLVYVADYAKMTRGTDEDRKSYAGIHAGFISQNVYLFCASEGLTTVVRAMVDREALAKALGLGPNLHVVLAQSVGYPKK